jgi:peptide/nickel transport system permease protein
MSVSRKTAPRSVELLAGGRTDGRNLKRRRLRRPLIVGCLAYLLIVVGVAVVAPIVLPQVAHQDAGNLLAVQQGPGAQHLLGTDSLGRDVLDRLLVGTRVTMAGVGEALLVVLLLGVPLGTAAGYFGGWVDAVVGWLSDLTFSMPAIVLILAVLAVFPENATAAMVTLGVIAAPGLMRIVRSATLPIRQEVYIAAARVSGLSAPYIISRHVLPRISGAVIVQCSLLAALALQVQTGLAFLNLVVAAPAPSWGGMVADGANSLAVQPWLIWPPGIAIAVTILVLGLLGDAVRDAATERWSSPTVRLGRRRGGGTRSGTRSTVPASMTDSALLSVNSLQVEYRSATGAVAVIDDVSFTVGTGETVGLVGESGCGKTTTALAILGLLPGGTRITAGSVWFDGQDLAAMSEGELQRVRGAKIGFVSQEPLISLNPAFRVGWQLAEAVRTHRNVSRREARRQAVQLLERVHLPDPVAVARRYPHELSGGMAQRVAIARALAGQPRLLIADEPTTALDVTVQAEILGLLRELQDEQQMATLFITHDWGVVADVCDRAVVMYAGQVVEQADVGPMLHEPMHPYTEALLAANPHNVTEVELLPTIRGDVPQPGKWPDGCHFHDRCQYATSGCRMDPIALERPSPGRTTRCIHHDELLHNARTVSS